MAARLNQRPLTGSFCFCYGWFPEPDHKKGVSLLPKLTFILGGARSGKSSFAEQLVRSNGKQRVYIATAQAFDAEMEARISAHRAQRGDGWREIEAPLDLSSCIDRITPDEVALLDCATLWLSNQLLADADLGKVTADLLASIDSCAGDLVVVSNEVGQGIVPENALARRFRDAQGRLNQQLAARAELAVLVAAGLPLVLKGQLPKEERV